MAEDKKNFDIAEIRSKLKNTRQEDEESGGWSAVSRGASAGMGLFAAPREGIDFIGKNLEGGKFAGENFENANFSVSNLSGVDFSGANLQGVNFSGANLSGANLSGANLTGAILSGAVLAKTNFSGAVLDRVVLTDADLEDAILLDIRIDALGLAELQALVEYMAKYYPHKLNLSKINLTLLDLSKIDLSRVSLRGVDFTGVDFTGVNILELDLSETNITPEQIAQALGRVPGPEELRRLMAPKVKKSKGNSLSDMADMFVKGEDYSVWDTRKYEGMSIDTLMKFGKKVFRRSADKPEVKDEEALEFIKSKVENEAKNHNQELRKVIEARKEQVLKEREEKKKQLEEEMAAKSLEKEPVRKKTIDNSVMERVQKVREYSRS